MTALNESTKLLTASTAASVSRATVTVISVPLAAPSRSMLTPPIRLSNRLDELLTEMAPGPLPIVTWASAAA